MHTTISQVRLSRSTAKGFFLSAALWLQLSPKMYFKITLIRSAIGLPGRTAGVLRALGLRKRFRTVYHPVSPQVAGQIMKVKELVAVSEVNQALTPQQMHELRKPDPGFFVETHMAQ